MEYRFNKKDLKFKKESFLNSQQRTRASNYKKNSEYKKTFKNKTFIPNKSNYKRWSNRELAVGSKRSKVSFPLGPPRPSIAAANFEVPVSGWLP